MKLLEVKVGRTQRGQSIISLTAHWVTPSFEKKSVMLNASPLPGSHTGNAIRMKYEEIFASWEIE